MRRVSGAVLLLLGIASAAQATPAPSARVERAPLASRPLLSPGPRLPSSPRTPFAPGEVLVLVRSGGSLAAAADGRPETGDARLATIFARRRLTRAQSLRQASPKEMRTFDALRLSSDDPDFDPVAAAAELRASGSVIAAAPNLHLRLDLAPNDPFFPNQWHLSTSAAAIHAQPAWNRETGLAERLDRHHGQRRGPAALRPRRQHLDQPG
jgi:hypothetical protein